MTKALGPSTHNITLNDNTIVHYHLQGLNNNDNRGDDNNNIERWTQFCSSVFSYKPSPPPPSYFARHFYNDPRCDAALVRVMIHCTDGSLSNDDAELQKGEIVSSVRIFRRTLSTGGTTTLEAGGIGEVCTSPNHQRRGLSKLLLKNAIDIMSSSSGGGGGKEGEESGGMVCSLLHANPEFRPVYHKVGGYESVSSKWSLVPIALNKLAMNSNEEIGEGWTTRQAVFPQDVPQLKALYTEYSEKRMITIVRSTEYWTNYVSAELGDTLWVLEDDDAMIVAWLSIRKRGGRYQLREFGVDLQKQFSVHSDITTVALSRLLSVALQQVGEDVTSESDEKISLLLPTIILSDMQENVDGATGQVGEEVGNALFHVDDVVEENDDGWMYVLFDESAPSVLELAMRLNDPIPHLIWPTDSF